MPSSRVVFTSVVASSGYHPEANVTLSRNGLLLPDTVPWPGPASGLNDFGAIAGEYVDSSGVNHGFVRAGDGTITPFNVTGAGISPVSIITQVGLITASCALPTEISPSSTLRARALALAKARPPNNINDFGVIAGSYIDSSGVDHGFVRIPGGNITTFNVKGAGTGSGQGTFADSNNLEGVSAGFYIDSSGVYHGFLRNP
jgi:hypothetical protein